MKSATNLRKSNMGWFMLEAAVALGLLVLIVWVTLPSKDKDKNNKD